MGLNSGGASQKTYLKITEGKIAQRVEEGEAGAIKCNNKEGTKVWYERHFNSISGYITNVSKKLRDAPYKPDLCFEIEDEGEVFELQVGWSSRYSSGFFTVMPNIDFNSKLTLTPYYKVVDGKVKTALYISKEGEKKSYDWFFTKEDTKGCPPMIQVRVNGEYIWDDSDRQDFFEKYLNEHIIPKLKKKASPISTTPSSRGSFVPPINQTQNGESDLSF